MSVAAVDVDAGVHRIDPLCRWTVAGEYDGLGWSTGIAHLADWRARRAWVARRNSADWEIGRRRHIDT